MELRGIELSDELKLSGMAAQYDFPVDLNNTFAHRVAENEGKIVAFGWLQLIVEANVIWDIKDRNKFEALKLILRDGKLEAKKTGFDQVHAFPKDSRFSEILKKHYDFRDVTGDVLVLNLG